MWFLNRLQHLPFSLRHLYCLDMIVSPITSGRCIILLTPLRRTWVPYETTTSICPFTTCVLSSCLLSSLSTFLSLSSSWHFKSLGNGISWPAILTEIRSAACSLLNGTAKSGWLKPLPFFSEFWAKSLTLNERCAAFETAAIVNLYV